jgi:hypothetical protein
MMTLILGRRQEPNNYAVLSIRGSESFTTPGHTSRQNPVHAEYIVFLVRVLNKPRRDKVKRD